MMRPCISCFSFDRTGSCCQEQDIRFVRVFSDHTDWTTLCLDPFVCVFSDRTKVKHGFTFVFVFSDSTETLQLPARACVFSDRAERRRECEAIAGKYCCESFGVTVELEETPEGLCIWVASPP